MRLTLIERLRQANFVLIGFFAALAILVAIAWTSSLSITRFEEGARIIEHTHWVISELEGTASSMKDADGAARGFYLTGLPEYLEPYDAALERLPAQLGTLRSLTNDNPAQQKNLSALREIIINRLDNLKQNISLRTQEDGADLITARVATGEGQKLMNALRQQISVMQEVEKGLLAERAKAFENEASDTYLIILFGNLAAFLMLAATFWLLHKEVTARRASDAALKRANRALLAQAGQLEATNKELEGFSYSISHDLRIPLRAVDGYAHMIEEDYADKLDEDGKRMLGVIRQNSTRMGNLIDDLLAFARLGRTRIAAEAIDMNVMVAQVIAELGARVDTGADANVNASDDPSILPSPDSSPGPAITVAPLAQAWGDRSLLRQVWTNLISNALKYSAKASPQKIHISGKPVGQEVVYSVADNGAGFDMQYYDKLFGVFQRLHSADEFPGTGVGLAIVQRVIVRHGGRVWAEGEIGRGACFHFALPDESAGIRSEGTPT